MREERGKQNEMKVRQTDKLYRATSLAQSAVEGFTLVELLIAGLIMAMISLSAFRFYAREHQVYSVQDQISEAQQNARIAMDAIALNVMTAGADLPIGYEPVESFDTNPDTIVLRYNKTGYLITVGDHTLIPSTQPIHTHDSVVCLGAAMGQLVYLTHNSPAPGEPNGEWFLLTNTAFNNGNGWYEINHSADLLGEPRPGDQVLIMEEVKYYIDNTDPANPKLMRTRNGQPAEVFAEGVTDLQFVYFLGNGAPDTVNSIVAPHDAREIENVQILIQSRTQKRDPNWPVNGGYRFRTLAKEVHLRNLNLN